MGGIDQVIIDIDQNGNFLVIVEFIYSSYLQGSCFINVWIFDICDYFSCMVFVFGNILFVEGLNCGFGDSFFWIILGVNKFG